MEHFTPENTSKIYWSAPSAKCQTFPTNTIFEIFLLSITWKLGSITTKSFPGILWCSFNFEDFINQQFVSLHHHFLSLHHHLIILFWTVYSFKLALSYYQYFLGWFCFWSLNLFWRKIKTDCLIQKPSFQRKGQTAFVSGGRGYF